MTGQKKGVGAVKKVMAAAVLVAAAVLLCGCSSFLYREYSVVEPHSSTYY